jgi:hypothetical protein
LLPCVAFVTIGQSPRADVLPEVLAEARTRLNVTERGALGGLDHAAIADLVPRPARNASSPAFAQRQNSRRWTWKDGKA